MTDQDREVRLRVDGGVEDDGVDRSRCVLCGGPNDCAMAAPPGSSSADATAEACWCVARRFPERLVRAATDRDGAAADGRDAC